jgi:3-oxoacyl-[acyl-carrier protein] reductase
MYTGKIVAITGSNRGVGKTIAEYILDNGGLVVGISRSDATIEHANYLHVKSDISKSDEVSAAFRTIARTYKRLDILINNAGVTTSAYAIMLAPTKAEEMININFFGTFLVSREAAKLMKINKFGRIISIGSMSSQTEPVGAAVYSATKAAIVTFSNTLAKELTNFNITCNTLGISAFKTDMLHQLAEKDINAIVDIIPVSRLAEKEDIFNVIDFFASEKSSYITAQSIFLGGIN